MISKSEEDLRKEIKEAIEVLQILISDKEIKEQDKQKMIDQLLELEN